MNKTGIYVRMIIVAPKTKNFEVVIKIHAVSDLGYIDNSGVMTSNYLAFESFSSTLQYKAIRNLVVTYFEYYTSIS